MIVLGSGLLSLGIVRKARRCPSEGKVINAPVRRELVTAKDNKRNKDHHDK